MLPVIILMAVIAMTAIIVSNKYDDKKHKNIMNNINGDTTDEAIKEL